MRELDELTRQISRKAQASSSEYPRPVPQIVGSLRRESRLLGEEWDALAVEVQREEIIVRISELETQIQELRQLPAADLTPLKEEIVSFRTILASRRDAVSGILASQVAKLRELKETGVKVSHVQKNQIKLDMLSMKGEISFLDQRAADLDKYLRLLENYSSEGRHGVLEDDSKNWDLWFEAAGHR
jgi:tetrahydromethanopterin S-methyltransferase subunit B